MDKNTTNKLYVVQDESEQKCLPKGTLVTILPNQDGDYRVRAKDLRLTPTRGRDDWWINRASLKELKHNFNVGDLAIYHDANYNSVPCKIVSISNRFLAWSLNFNAAYYVVYSPSKINGWHKGTTPYFKGGNDGHYYYALGDNLKPMQKSKYQYLTVKLRQAIEDAKATKSKDDIISIWRSGNEVIAISGIKRGVAKCNPTDTFDYYTGASIALLRLFTGAK